MNQESPNNALDVLLKENPMNQDTEEKHPYYNLVDEALRLHTYTTEAVQDRSSTLPDLIAAAYFAFALPKVVAKMAAAKKDLANPPSPDAPHEAAEAG